MPLSPTLLHCFKQAATRWTAALVMVSLPVLAYSQSAPSSGATPQKSSQSKAAPPAASQKKAASQQASQKKTVASTPKSAQKSTQKAASARKQVTSNKRQQTARAATQKKARAKADATNYVSVGSRLGLRSQEAELVLNSSAVLVIDQRTNEVLLEKNPDVALPIASITKLMTALVTLEAGLPMEEEITITQEDAQLEKYSASRLKVGSQFSRAELLHLALMSSENRAAQALGRTYPGGLSVFVQEMNATAQRLGMARSRFVEPTGLSSNNVATPRDLAILVNASYQFSLIRQYSTDRGAIVTVGGRQQQFVNTNALARGEVWDIGVSKTGFIRDAGRCLVMQTTIQNNPVIMVMLDAQATGKRIADAERIRRWLSTQDNYAGFRS
jgi:serine-type D-Ala-D-Ala endopeptidase (penicillin-binding protein 7)